MKAETVKSLAIGATVVIVIFAALIGLLLLVTGTSPVESAGERFVYKSIGERSLAVWAFKPKTWRSDDRRAAVVWFFGGGWETGSPWQFSEHAEWLAKRGLVSIVVDYRVRARDGTSPFEAAKDARSAVRWIRANAARLGIDPQRIVVAGGSVGGHLAVGCVLFDGRDDETKDDLSVSPRPDALVLLNPLLDIDIPIVHERTSAEQFESLRRISPVDLLDGEPLPATLILHGSADRIIPIASVEGFVAKARELGEAQIRLVSYPGVTHEFYLPGVGSKRQFKQSMAEIWSFLVGLGWVTNQASEAAR